MLRRVLLAQTSFLGDVVLTTALARVIAGALPEAELHWLVRPDAVSLIEPTAGAGRVIAFDKRGAERGIGGVRALARRLEAQRFDAAIAVQRSLRTAALLAMARIPLRVGYAGTAGSWLHHRRVARTGAHARDRLVELARGLGIEPALPYPDPKLAVDPEAAARVGERLARAGFAAGERLLVVAPGSAWATKRWPAERFGAAARDLVPERADRVVVIGTAADRPLAAEIERALAGRAPVLDATGEAGFADAVAMLERAHLVLANDSAPAHVAAALGRPVVALFGPTVPEQGFGPLGPRVRIVERELPCRPCSRHGSERCPIGTHECLADLPPSNVVAAARALLEGGVDEPARGEEPR